MKLKANWYFLSSIRAVSPISDISRRLAPHAFLGLKTRLALHDEKKQVPKEGEKQNRERTKSKTKYTTRYRGIARQGYTSSQCTHTISLEKSEKGTV
jgi:hypothetical protein